MKHEEFKILVSAYRDGEVTAEERAQVEAHLAECAECTAALAAYERLGQTVHNLPRGVPSRALWLRVQQGIAPRRLSLWRRLLPVVPALALLAIGITLFVVLGVAPTKMSPGAPAIHREALSTEGQLLAQPPAAASPVPQPTSEAYAAAGIQSTAGGTMPSPCPGAEDLAVPGVPPCPGVPLALELVSVSVRSDEEYTTPRLQGVLYNAEGEGLPDVMLVVSNTAGWQGTVTTTTGGAFALDLPERGTYRIALALAPVAAKALTEEDTATYDNYRLPDGAVCRGRRDMALAPLTLDIHDEAIVTLRVR